MQKVGRHVCLVFLVEKRLNVCVCVFGRLRKIKTLIPEKQNNHNLLHFPLQNQIRGKEHYIFVNNNTTNAIKQTILLPFI